VKLAWLTDLPSKLSPAADFLRNLSGPKAGVAGEAPEEFPIMTRPPQKIHDWQRALLVTALCPFVRIQLEMFLTILFPIQLELVTRMKAMVAGQG
jgi:hypothetical protein